MANQEHLTILKQGIATWNMWRKQHPEIRPDLSFATLNGADLRGADLREATLRGALLSFALLSFALLSRADLRGAILSFATLIFAVLLGADLRGATLNGADLRGATLKRATLSGANLRGANLRGADLRGATLKRAILSGADLGRTDLGGAFLSDADLSRADLRGATLNGADLSRATLVRTNLTAATLTECRIYGISAWNTELTEATQDRLVITPPDQPTITVDTLKIAQFIHLLRNNQEIRDVITTSTTKIVLLLGRFTPERKVVLDALRNSLHTKDYVPIIFDFDKPASKDTQETITTLARLARFVIADLTEARSIPQEFVSIVEALPSLAIQPLLQRDSEPWGMYDHIQRYPWVLPIQRYTDLADLLATLEARVIDPAERKAQELTQPS